MEKPENLGTSLMKSLGSQYLGDLSVEFSEIAMDLILEEGLAKNIPFYQLYKAVTAVRDLALLKKTYTFLFEHKDIPLTDRIRFISQFETDKDLREYGETVLMLLDRVIHVTKAQLIGRLSRAHILGRIDKSTFSILSEAVDRVFLSDLPELVSYYKGKSPQNFYDIYTQERLANAGLMTLNDESVGGLAAIPEIGFVRHVNAFGKIFVQVALIDSL
jgi:hypothetical protein